MKATIHTLGCRLNQADAALIADSLRDAGFDIVPWGKTADLIIINSCTVTGAAAQKTRQAARAARRRHPGAYIILAGCEANIGSSDWDPLETVDLVVPNPDKMSLVHRLPTKLRPNGASRQPTQMSRTTPEAKLSGFTHAGVGYYPKHTRANLKIQEGCDGFCSYCIVPLARGRSRSRDWDDILREASLLLDAGHKEIVLTGVNVASYAHGGKKLADLIQALLDLSTGFRIRLSSTELFEELDPVVDLMAREPRLCRFLHLPIQHGSDRILDRMKRPYTVAAFAEATLNAYRQVPGICLGTDVIVGFPGETEADFAECVATVQRLPFGLLHVFRYSPRPGTPAADMPNQVNGDVAAERAKALAVLGKRKSVKFAESQVGKVLKVLTENTNSRGRREGWSDNYLRVELPGPAGQKNQFVQARVESVIDGRYVTGANQLATDGKCFHSW